MNTFLVLSMFMGYLFGCSLLYILKITDTYDFYATQFAAIPLTSGNKEKSHADDTRRYAWCPMAISILFGSNKHSFSGLTISILMLFSLLTDTAQAANVNYDNNWITGSPLMPRLDHGFSIGYWNDAIFLLGGAGTPQALVKLNILTHDFTDLTANNLLTTNLSGRSQTSTQIGHMLFSVNQGGAALSSFDLSTTAFNPLFKNLNVPVSDHGSSCITSKDPLIFIVGGGLENAAMNNFQVLNVATLTWIPAPNMIVARGQAGCIIHGEYVYAVGGYDNGWLASIERIAFDGFTWGMFGNLQHSVCGHRLVTYGKNILSLGGYTDVEGGASTDEMQVIDTITGLVYVNAVKMSYEWRYAALITVNEIVYTFGGFEISGGTDKWQYYILPDTVSPTKSPTNIPTQSPTTLSPTTDPTQSPTTSSPTKPPTSGPTKSPTNIPTPAPTNVPTPAPTDVPTLPTYDPTYDPTTEPTLPTNAPSDAPTTPPTIAPSKAPTTPPSNAPSHLPSAAPSKAPTTPPSNAPSLTPTFAPSTAPTHPTNSPTFSPSIAPSTAPSNFPTMDPTSDPTADPTHDPTADPTIDPTDDPTIDPTMDPTMDPTTPTTDPTTAPSFSPSIAPSNAPTLCLEGTYSGRMVADEYLWSDSNDSMISNNCLCKFLLSKTGNLLVFENGEIKWETNTSLVYYSDQSVSKFTVNNDGSIVIHEYPYKHVPSITPKVLWISNVENQNENNENNTINNHKFVLYLTNYCCLELIDLDHILDGLYWTSCMEIQSTQISNTISEISTSSNSVNSEGKGNDSNDKPIWIWMVLSVGIILVVLIGLIIYKRYLSNVNLNSNWITSNPSHNYGTTNAKHKRDQSDTIENDNETTKQINEWVEQTTEGDVEIMSGGIEIQYTSVELQHSTFAE